MEKINQFFSKNPIKKLAIIIGSFITIIVLISVISIIVSEPKVTISFDTKTSIPDGELKNLRSSLYGIIRDNSENFDSNKTFKGTAKNYEENVSEKSGSASFLVDFEDIKQDYFIRITWPDPNDGSPNFSIDCPIDSLYPETPCKTETTDSSNIDMYLPHDGTTESGLTYTIVGKFYADQYYVEIQANSCGNVSILNEALDSAKDWIKTRNINPEDYTFYTPTNLCDGEAHSSAEGDDFIPQYYNQVNKADTTDENVNNSLPLFIPDTYNVYPLVDENKNVTSIKIEIAGCTDFQTKDVEEEILNYLESKNINYPKTFEYCKN